MTPEETLKSRGYELPELPPALGSYVPCVQTGNLLMTSGQLPMKDGQLLAKGKVGTDVTLEEAAECARQCTLNALAAAKSVLGELSRIRRVVKVNGFVASDPGFTDQPKVINGASDLLARVLGDAGTHARSAVGMAVLPADAPVEIDYCFEVE